ncbi:MAG: NUDIX domain-containing protein [Chloroflexi bacterium]|nr:NUDIX domain-containing protein [Chloroflexota bacterium]
MRRAWSVAVFARHAGQVLLVHHRRLDLWLPAGGELEPGETPLQAATRELFEETGLRGTFPRTSDLDGAPPGLLGYEEHQAGAKGTHLNFNFLADVPSTDVLPNHEFESWRWVASPDDVACPPNVRQLLARILDGKRA